MRFRYRRWRATWKTVRLVELAEILSVTHHL
jgi:hypothetical protein